MTSSRTTTTRHHSNRRARPAAAAAAARATCIYDIIAILIQHGADLEAPDKLGDRPLHVACRQGDVEACRMLLACGSDVTARNHAQQTPADCCNNTTAGNNQATTQPVTTPIKQLITGYLYDLQGHTTVSPSPVVLQTLQLPAAATEAAAAAEAGEPGEPGEARELEDGSTPAPDPWLLPPPYATGYSTCTPGRVVPLYPSCDVLDDVPSDCDDEDDCQDKDDDVTFEHYQHQPIATYKLALPESNNPKNYVLLDNVAGALNLDPKEFCIQHPEHCVTKIPLGHFYLQTSHVRIRGMFNAVLQTVDVVEATQTLRRIIRGDFCVMRGLAPHHCEMVTGGEHKGRGCTKRTDSGSGDKTICDSTTNAPRDEQAKRDASVGDDVAHGGGDCDRGRGKEEKEEKTESKSVGGDKARGSKRRLNRSRFSAYQQQQQEEKPADETKQQQRKVKKAQQAVTRIITMTTSTRSRSSRSGCGSDDAVSLKTDSQETKTRNGGGRNEGKTGDSSSTKAPLSSTSSSADTSAATSGTGRATADLSQSTGSKHAMSTRTRAGESSSSTQDSAVGPTQCTPAAAADSKTSRNSSLAPNVAKCTRAAVATCSGDGGAPVANTTPASTSPASPAQPATSAPSISYVPPITSRAPPTTPCAPLTGRHRNLPPPPPLVSDLHPACRRKATAVANSINTGGSGGDGGGTGGNYRAALHRVSSAPTLHSSTPSVTTHQHVPALSDTIKTLTAKLSRPPTTELVQGGASSSGGEGEAKKHAVTLPPLLEKHDSRESGGSGSVVRGVGGEQDALRQTISTSGTADDGAADGRHHHGNKAHAQDPDMPDLTVVPV